MSSRSSYYNRKYSFVTSSPRTRPSRSNVPIKTTTPTTSTTTAITSTTVIYSATTNTNTTCMTTVTSTSTTTVTAAKKASCGSNSQDTKNTNITGVCSDAPKLQPNDPYTTNIFLICHNYSNFLGFYQLLKVSLQFSNLQLEEDYEMTLNFIFCTMTGKGVRINLPLGRGQGKTNREARNDASEKSLEMLLQKCFTLQVNKKASSDGEVSLEGIDGTFGADFEKISDDNVGAKLLKLMGWSGGALGKSGEGITEPVQTSSVIGRQGLGIQNENGVTPQFVNKVRYIIKKFRTNDDTSDLVFPSDLSAEQRKQIHIIASQLGKNKLKTIAIGKGRHRYLVVKKKFDGLDLIRMVLAQGGVTDKYELCKPGILTLDDLSKDNFI